MTHNLGYRRRLVSYKVPGTKFKTGTSPRDPTMVHRRLLHGPRMVSTWEF